MEEKKIREEEASDAAEHAECNAQAPWWMMMIDWLDATPLFILMVFVDIIGIFILYDAL